ncbi:MAG: hypothetical protein K6G84_05205 [Lachnospiraceae bacterium]|nr:hypothetical protein [Lachnospiraceae bacterium]
MHRPAALNGVIYNSSFDSSIHFPKKKDTAFGYENVMKKHNKTVIESYNLVETETELYFTEQVNNIMFLKNIR